ncbi:hypothetical protein AGR1B_Lc10498 [Agrobacterium fabacearum S56]|nr:hypothetical protein AGR1B_Lc10498 [Agrobacterium fabacearum S56]
MQPFFAFIKTATKIDHFLSIFY